ncbi:glutathione S-transferase family protein [Rhizobium sp. Root149]|uniref:glutathione S-transferase family protein n=1 Tax=Rhizobium sp. Root149 TaxID=1736473 RepID=UPI0009EBDB77|nr:glutathione S-transferase family protein [Rhizobium sp. Root149]
MASLTLYTNPMSRGRIARWMLEEIGTSYDVVVINYGPEMKADAYRAINPMGKVPALKHGDAVVTECAAICAYLADAFPEARLAPPTDQRADYYRWLFFAAGPLEAAITNQSLGFVVPSERQGSVGYGSYDAVLNALEAHLAQREYIAGSSFSAADVYVGSHLMWGLQFGTIEKRGVFESYVDRLAPRAAHVRATELDDALISR